MMSRFLIAPTLAATLLLPALALAADPLAQRPQNQAAPQSQERIYGSQLMTPQERSEHRARMRAAHSATEREQIRREHHRQIQERAKAHGITLPAEPPARGPGMGGGR